MKISHALLDMCMEYIADETKLEEFLMLVGNDDFDEDTGTYIAAYILDSLIVEKMYNYQKVAIETEYAKINKLKLSALEKRNEKRKFEDSFAVGMSKFFSVFDDVFEHKDILLKKLRKPFKNYRFRKLNIVNDYSMFFSHFISLSYTVKNTMT